MAQAGGGHLCWVGGKVRQPAVGRLGGLETFVQQLDGNRSAIVQMIMETLPHGVGGNLDVEFY